jgi:predicted transcriptional regulator
MERRWKFLTHHALVLLAIVEDPEATLRKIGDRVGITERAAQGIVNDLVEAGYLRRRRRGRRNVYGVNHAKRLRHPMARDRKVGELLSLLADEAGGEEP